MPKFSDVSGDVLREELATTDDPKAVKRLMIALAYLDGVPVRTLSARYGIPEPTIYDWLDRFEGRSPGDAATDDPRPGRPPSLDAGSWAAIEADVAESPRHHGYDAASWTPALLAHHLETTYGVSYSVGHVRRLVRSSDLAL